MTSSSSPASIPRFSSPWPRLASCSSCRVASVLRSSCSRSSCCVAVFIVRHFLRRAHTASICCASICFCEVSTLPGTTDAGSAIAIRNVAMGNGFVSSWSYVLVIIFFRARTTTHLPLRSKPQLPHHVIATPTSGACGSIRSTCRPINVIARRPTRSGARPSITQQRQRKRQWRLAGMPHVRLPHGLRLTHTTKCSQRTPPPRELSSA